MRNHLIYKRKRQRTGNRKSRCAASATAWVRRKSCVSHSATLATIFAVMSILTLTVTDAAAQSRDAVRGYQNGPTHTYQNGSADTYGNGADWAYRSIAPIAPENRCAPYKRNVYSYPQSVEPQIARSMGEIYGPYEARVFDSMLDTTIEHIVALSEAHDSGLCNASPTLKREFARDLDNLTLASSVVNQRKGGRDAAGWVPQHNQCWFASRVVAVKRKYKLSFDRREATALQDILSQCDSTEMYYATIE